MADSLNSTPVEDTTSDTQTPTSQGSVGDMVSDAPPPPPWVSAPQEEIAGTGQPENAEQPKEETLKEAQPTEETSLPQENITPPADPSMPPISPPEGTIPPSPTSFEQQESISPTGTQENIPQMPPAPIEESIPSEGIPPQPEGSGVIPSPPPSSFSTSSVAATLGGNNNAVRSSIFKYLMPILGVLVILGLIFFVVTKFVLPNFSGEGAGEKKGSEKKVSKEKASLTYWGLWEPESVMNQVVADYQQTHPNVSINYIKQSHKDYRERLQSALGSGTGPDIFRFHNTWVSMLKNELVEAPSGTIDLNVFYPTVSKDIAIGQKVYGVPLEFDGLALYYNPKIFKQGGKAVPTTWEDLRKTAAELTVKDASGKIQTAGVALGTTNNVDNFSDILGLMLLQNGADPSDTTSQLVQDAIQFYTIFTTTDKVWDESLPSSTYAFATEKVAMFLAPSWRAFEIKEISPTLEFGVAPVPQLPGSQVAWASYWVEGVSKKSKNTKEAWEFLKYLSSEAVVTKLYTAESNLRLFGEPYALKSLGATLENDSHVGAFVKQGPYAKSWYLCSRTHDNGINDKIIKYFEDAVNSIISGKDIPGSLKTASSGVTQVLSQYGLGKAPTQQVAEPQIGSPSSEKATPANAPNVPGTSGEI